MVPELLEYRNLECSYPLVTGLKLTPFRGLHCIRGF